MMTKEANKIRLELEKVGVNIDDIYDLVNTKMQYPNAIPVLINLLREGIETASIKEGIIRALAVKQAIGKATPILMDEYMRTSKDNMSLRWAIGNTIYTTITKDDIDSILPIVSDKSNGISRQMFVTALGKVNSDKVENVLIKLLHDDEVIVHAIQALGRMRSNKAKKRIVELLNHPKLLVRKEAQKALSRIP